MSDERGVVTIACGARAYTEMAVDLALSLREHDATRVALLADAAAYAHVHRNYPRVFDAVVPLPDAYRVGHAFKFAVAELTPYRHNLFIDADTLVLSSLTAIWPESECALAMMGMQRTRDTHETHHGFSIRDLIDEFELTHYFDNHSGAFYFHGELARPFLRECRELYVSRLYTRARRLRGMVGDELAFGIVGGRHGVRRLAEPYPVLWLHELSSLRPGDVSKPLCHVHAPLGAAALAWLVEATLRRRRAAGLTVGDGGHWVAKSERAARNRRIGARLERLRSAASRSLGWLRARSTGRQPL